MKYRIKYGKEKNGIKNHRQLQSINEDGHLEPSRIVDVMDDGHTLASHAQGNLKNLNPYLLNPNPHLTS